MVLQLPISNPDLLPSFIETCIRDGVALIAIVGEGCRDMEDIIDELIVGDGSDQSRFSQHHRRDIGGSHGIRIDAGAEGSSSG